MQVTDTSPIRADSTPARIPTAAKSRDIITYKMLPYFTGYKTRLNFYAIYKNNIFTIFIIRLQSQTKKKNLSL